MKKLQDLPEVTQAFVGADTEYKYQPQLTKKLDNHSGDFSEMTLLEIALWKTNRYPSITHELLDDINALRKSYDEEKAKNLLRKLLEMRGFDLPMASTVLRFAVPSELQIIDQRVYRFITPREDCLKIPYRTDQKVEVYFKYIERLRNICDKYGIPFFKADRLLYQLDKTHNKDIPLSTS